MRVRQALEAGPLLVIAGAGFGKTTILGQTLYEPRRAVAWIPCTEAERDPGRLLFRLIRSVSEALPGAADAAAEQLAAGAERIDVEAATRHLLTDLGDVLVDPLFVVLDDAEQLEGATGSLTLVILLLQAEIPLLRVAVATRRELELRSAKLRATGRLTELGPADLSFSAEECAELLRSVRGHAPEPDEVEGFVSATHGWPLGVALLASAPADRALPMDESVLGDLSEARFRETLHAYLAEEVLDALAPELREAVIESSVSRTLTPGIVEALALPDGFVDAVERAGIPVRRQVTERDAASYHPFFREFLLSRLEAERDEEAWRSLHARVAPVVADAGDPVEAIQHWLEAGAWAELVPCLEQAGAELVRTSPELVRGWLDRLPPKARSQPGMRLLEGQLEWGAGGYPRATELLRDAVDGLRARGDALREWMGRLMLADCLGWMSDVDGAARVAAGFDQPEARGAGPLAPATAFHAAMMLATFGRMEESDRIAERARRHPESSAIAWAECVRKAVVEIPGGNHEAAIEANRAALRQAERQDPFNLRLYVMSSLAQALEDAGRPDEALAVWQAMQEEASPGNAAFAVRESHNWCAMLHVQAGRVREAGEELALGGATGGWRKYMPHLVRACLAALRGDAAETVSAGGQALELQRSAPPLFRFWTAENLIPALARMGHRERARALLGETARLVDATYPGGDGCSLRARLLGLRAWLSHTDGDQDRVDEDLLAMWREAGSGRRFALRREWGVLEPVVWSALERALLDPEEVVDGIAEAFPEGVPLVPFTGHPVPEVRRASLGPAIASGHPEAIERLRDLIGDPDPDVASAAEQARERIEEIAPPLRFRLLGDFSLHRGAWRVDEAAWDRPTAARLVRFLLVHRDETVPEDVIFEALWPDLSPEAARRSLQVAVSRARRVLDLPGVARSLLESIDGSYRLALGERDTIDADGFESAAKAGLADRGSDRLRMMERAASLWGGEPLPAERYSEWTTAWRERLVDRYIEVLTALVGLHNAAGDHPSAIRAARELVELDPLNEGAHRELIVAFARSGRPGHALRQYLECRRALVEGLGVEPTEQTSRLQALVLAGEPV